MKKITLIALAVIAGLALASCKKSGDTKLESKIDTLSYAIGAFQGAEVKRNLQKDTVGELFDAFVDGFEKGISSKEDSSTLYYSIGMQIASQLKMMANEGFQGDSTLKLNKEIIKEAFLASVKNNKPMMTSDEANTLLSDISNKIKEEKAMKEFGSNKAAGEKFLADNKSQAGVVTLPSGLQYKVIKEGKGVKPSASDKVKVHYEGKLIDGKVFDSSIARKEPVVFPVTGVIKGWTEALQLMPVGSKWQLFVPSELAYGGQEGGPIPPFSVLVFEVELISIEK